MPNDKVLLMLGLAKRAGKVSTGVVLCEKDIKSKKSELIIIAEDVSDNTRKSIINSCEYYSVKYIEYSDMFDLGNAVGADGERGVVSVNDEGFAKTIFEKYSDLKSGRNGE